MPKWIIFFLDGEIFIIIKNSRGPKNIHLTKAWFRDDNDKKYFILTFYFFPTYSSFCIWFNLCFKSYNNFIPLMMKKYGTLKRIKEALVLQWVSIKDKKHNLEKSSIMCFHISLITLISWLYAYEHNSIFSA